jgi:hypothetical protein
MDVIMKDLTLAFFVASVPDNLGLMRSRPLRLLFYCEPGAFVILMDVIMKDLTLAFESE